MNRPTSGITRYTQEILVALQRARVSVTVLHAGRARSNNGVVPLHGSARAPALLTLGQVEIAWHTYRRNLALVHDPTGLVPLSLTRAARVATIHDVISCVYPDSSTRLNRLVDRLWLPSAVQRLDGIVTDSNQSKADIVNYLGVGPERVFVVPLGVDRRYRTVGPKHTHATIRRLGITFPYILYLSAVTFRNKRKNLLRLLEAYARMRQWSDHWTLVIAGSVGGDAKAVFESIERLQLTKHVHIPGFVAEEDLPALYAGADLFVWPSLYEGFGLPVLEAMACGTPVVTSNASSLPEVAGDAAILVDPHSVDEIQHAMRRVLSEPALATGLRERGILRSREFNWERTARQTISVYERVLGQELWERAG